VLLWSLGYGFEGRDDAGDVYSFRCVPALHKHTPLNGQGFVSDQRVGQ
jgi:hypothetical protein